MSLYSDYVQLPLGAFVIAKAHARAMQHHPKEKQSRRVCIFQIVEIVNTTTAEGTSTRYRCRGGTPDGINDKLLTFAKEELDLAPEPEPDPS